jgi:hypothetical protein
MALSGIRDRAIEEYLWRFEVCKRTSSIRNMKNLEIDSKQKTFLVKLELAGESEPLTVTGSYRLISEGGKTMLAPADIQTSKEWLTILAGELVKGRTFEVPGIVRSIL